jgi:hypothetical protein
MQSKQLFSLVRRLRVRNGSIVLVKVTEDDLESERLVPALTRALKQSGLQDVFVIGVETFDDIETMDVRAMNKLGWFRREQVETLYKRIPRRSDD